jgi:flagellar basal-body rod protein FlgB
MAYRLLPVGSDLCICMIDALFNQPNYLATKKMLDATALRHEAIASNLANLETPNYKRIDVAPNFTTQLQQALASKDGDRLSSLQPSLVVDSASKSANKDGNTVQLETELMNLNQNTLAHTLETQLLTGSLLRLRLAITGRQV